jgi:hypothetical protein
MNVDLKLTLEELNVIVGILAQRPFMEVHLLLKKITEQAAPQLQQETRED